ncbi:adenosine deaminase [Prunus dulcis]|uniref:Adenosine deaminase n=1 Tax=Prunus dulcis TaxID=3755 RepID=A0A4Y1R0B8_PRUDU|nr:adenosine deaminase [Prunus dulcis]
MLVKLIGPRFQKLEIFESGLPVTFSKESVPALDTRESKSQIFVTSAYSKKSITTTRNTTTPKRPEFPLQCTEGINVTQACPRTYPTTHDPTNPSRPSNLTCPSYFRWIHEDLRPWKETGITRDMIEKGLRATDFRLLILLRLYPGRLPDLELMFNCGDLPVIPSKDFRGPNAGPPPLFHYCADQWSLDIEPCVTYEFGFYQFPISSPFEKQRIKNSGS